MSSDSWMAGYLNLFSFLSDCATEACITYSFRFFCAVGLVSHGSMVIRRKSLHKPAG